MNIPVGGSVTYSLTANLASNATGSLVNTATTAVASGSNDPTPANNSATDTDTVTSRADLVITKTDGAASEIPGTPVTYTIVATNNGPSNVTGATVTDTLPATITGATWTCVASSGSSCTASGSGNIADTINLVNGGTATYSITGTISRSASGSLTNSASVAVPSGTTDPTPANNSNSDTDTLNPVSDLAITKTDSSASATPGGTVTYTIIGTNNGPSNVLGATITDTLPSALSSGSWTCVAASGATCAASGTGNLTDTVNIPVGGSVTYTLTASVSSTATGSLANTASIAVPSGWTDSTPANNSATDTDTLSPAADLQISKTDGSATATAGGTVVYTLVATNNGPSAVVGARVTDTLPVSLTGATWTCAPVGGSCSASGSGNLNELVNLSVGGTATFTITATLSAAATGSLANTAAVAAPVGTTDGTPGNNSATDTDTITRSADVSVTKTDGQASATPGSSVTYTIVATNAGPSNITGVTVSDVLPVTLTGATWTCVASSGATCAASGTGSIADTIALAVGSTATYTLTANVSPSATGSITNSATVSVPSGATDPNSANNTATDVDALGARAELSITKTDGQTSEIPGTTATYTIVATNAGPSDAPGTIITDTPPASLVGVTWTCAATGGATCSASGSTSISDTVNIPSGGTVTYTLTGTISASATGTLDNTATVDGPSSVVDTNPADDTATDSDTLGPRADLTVTKTDGAASATPGSPVTYTVVVTNNGPSVAVGATVADTLPAAITGATWTCVGASGGSCAASGSGNITDTINLAVGGTATYTVTGTISATATGTLANTATVTVPSGTTDPTPANNSSTDTDTLTPRADLAVTKTDGAASEVPGTPVTYTIVATNNGPSVVVGAPINDVIPSALSNAGWNCVASAGATCGSAFGTGDIIDTVSLAVGATVTYTLTADINPTATGSLTNTASIAVPSGTVDPVSANNSGVDTDTLDRSADLEITKTDSSLIEVPGTPVTYTIVATNNGPSTVVGATITDTIPSGAYQCWMDLRSVGGSDVRCGLRDRRHHRHGEPRVGASVTYTLTADVRATATGNLVNTATISAPSGVTDSTPANNTTPTPTPSTPPPISRSPRPTAPRAKSPAPRSPTPSSPPTTDPPT